MVVHPRRWAWLASYTDTTGRPLVSPTAGGYNALAAPGEVVSAGRAGSVLGLEVWTDPNVPTNLGAGTNQDAVLMFKRDDIWLWESALRRRPSLLRTPIHLALFVPRVRVQRDDPGPLRRHPGPDPGHRTRHAGLRGLIFRGGPFGTPFARGTVPGGSVRGLPQGAISHP